MSALPDRVRPTGAGAEYARHRDAVSGVLAARYRGIDADARQELIDLLESSSYPFAGPELTANIYPSPEDNGGFRVFTLINRVGGTSSTDNTFAGRRPYRCFAYRSNG